MAKNLSIEDPSILSRHGIQLPKDPNAPSDPLSPELRASGDPFDDFEDDDFDDEFDDDFEEEWDDDLEDDGFGPEYQEDPEEESGDTFPDDPDFDQ